MLLGSLSKPPLGFLLNEGLYLPRHDLCRKGGGKKDEEHKEPSIFPCDHHGAVFSASRSSVGMPQKKPLRVGKGAATVGVLLHPEGTFS